MHAVAQRKAGWIVSKPLALLYYSNLIPGSQLANRLIDMGYRVQALSDLKAFDRDVSKRKTPPRRRPKSCPGGPAFGDIARLRKDPATQHIPVLGYSRRPGPGAPGRGPRRRGHVAGRNLRHGRTFAAIARPGFAS